MSLRATAVALLLLIAALHLPVFTDGALITPAGMHYAMSPWKSGAAEAVARGALVEENPALSDLFVQIHPWQAHIARSAAAGDSVLWNPLSYGGAPFLANAQSAVLYPLHWPVRIFPTIRVFTLAILAKLFLAGFFMAIFLRGLGCGAAPCVLGSAAFALCGFMTSWLGYAHTNTAIFLPLLMHGARLAALSPGAGPFLLIAGATGAQFLGGHPETSLHILAASAACFAWHLSKVAPRMLKAQIGQISRSESSEIVRISPGPGSSTISRPPWGRSAAWFAGALVLGAALAAAQLLPFLEYLSKSAALASRGDAPSLDPSLPAESLMALISPWHFGVPWRFTYEGPAAFQAIAGYTGSGVLLMALLSLRRCREARFFHLLAAASALVVYGPQALRDLLRAVPVVGLGSHNRLLLVLSFALATAAALELHRRLARGNTADGSEVVRANPRPAKLSEKALPERAQGEFLSIAGPAVLGGLLIALAFVFPPRDDHARLVPTAVLAGAVALLTLAAFRPSSRSLAAMGIAALSSFDLFAFALRFNPHADPSELYRPTGLTEFVRRAAAEDPARGGRIMTVGWTMRPETHMVAGIASIEGYDAMEPAPYRRILDRARVDLIHRTGVIPAEARPLLDLLGARFFLTPPGAVVSGERMRLVYDAGDGRVFINDDALPRFSIVASPDDLGSRSGDEATATSLSVARDRPGAIAVTVGAGGADRKQWLRIGEGFDGGWRAEVNGSRVEIARASEIFMAVPLTKGACVVTLEYAPRSFLVGAIISVASLAVWVAVGARASMSVLHPPRSS